MGFKRYSVVTRFEANFISEFGAKLRSVQYLRLWYLLNCLVLLEFTVSSKGATEFTLRALLLGLKVTIMEPKVTPVRLILVR